MGQLHLVRHGQANTGATNEEDYDKLSSLGHTQAAMLGDWLRDHQDPYDLVISGTMRRHVETAQGMGFPVETKDPRLNEMEYFALVRDMEAKHGLAPPTCAEDFATHMPRALHAWEQKTIDGAEPFATFETRIMTALAEAIEPGKRVLCITSGGVISMIIRAILGLDVNQMAQIILPVYNSSLHKFKVTSDSTTLMSFNLIPHLDAPALEDHRTHI